MNKVLLVEDSQASMDLIEFALRSIAEVTWVSTIAQAFESLKTNEYDLILLDVGLPDGDGFRFYSAYLNDPAQKEIPVIFITTKDNVSDKVLGFSLGAEDYITKPFQPAEFRARVEMRLKKQRQSKQKTQTLRIGDLEILLGAQRAFLIDKGAKNELSLTPMEFKLLNFLVNNEDIVFSRNQLLDQVWGKEVHLTDRSIDTHVCNLRKKLGKYGHCVQAIYGEGYRFRR